MPPRQGSGRDALAARGFERIRVLGRGSFGEAALVRDRSRGALVVAKRVQLGNLSRKEAQEAENEIGILRRLSHPNIVRYIDSFHGDSCLFIIMEYADGGDLGQRLQKQKGTLLPEEGVLHLFVQLCLAVKHLHDQHILHRDLKTQNIFLSAHRTHPLVKLGDFGISTQLRNTLALAKTMCGTPYYFSPELCQNRPYNNKTDIWSCGCILYELCTLRHAFDGSNMQSLMARIIRGTYQRPPAHFSEPLRKLIDSMLTRDPQQRPSVNRILALDWIQARVRRIVEESAPAPPTPPTRPQAPGGSTGSGARPKPGSAPRRSRSDDPLERSKAANDQFQRVLDRNKENNRARPVAAAPPLGQNQQGPRPRPAPGPRPAAGGANGAAAGSGAGAAAGGMEHLREQLAAVQQAIDKRMADREREARREQAEAGAARERARQRAEQERQRAQQRERERERERERARKEQQEAAEARRQQRGQAALAAERQRIRALQQQQREQEEEAARRRSAARDGWLYAEEPQAPCPGGAAGDDLAQQLRREMAAVPLPGGAPSRFAQMRGIPAAPPADAAAAFRDARLQAELNRLRPTDPFAGEAERQRREEELAGRLGLLVPGAPCEPPPSLHIPGDAAGRPLDLQAQLAPFARPGAGSAFPGPGALGTDLNLQERLEAEGARALWERQRARIEAQRGAEPRASQPAELCGVGEEEAEAARARAAWERQRGRIEAQRDAPIAAAPPSDGAQWDGRSRTPQPRHRGWPGAVDAAAPAEDEWREEWHDPSAYGVDWEAMQRHFRDAVLGAPLDGDEYFEEPSGAAAAGTGGALPQQHAVVCGRQLPIPAISVGGCPVGAAQRAADLRAFLSGALGADRVRRAVAALADAACSGDEAAERRAAEQLTGGLPDTDDLVPLLSQLIFCEQLAQGR